MSGINLVGTRLQNGKYVIQDELGRGGFGVTYRAMHQSLNQVVVVKTLHWADNDSGQQRQKFQAEARRLAQCQHPNIVNVTDFFVEAERPYLVMDFIPGQPLSAIIFPNRPLSEALAVQYIRQIASALQTVHGQGLLHRDVKPQNIMINDGSAILIDFGIARELVSGQTQTQTNLVSEGYAPLEQYLPKARRSAASDVYGLAATLYSAVTGQVPVASVVRSHHPLTPPRQLNPQISQTVEHAILQGMALKLAQRPQSVATWLALFNEAAPNPTRRRRTSSPPPQVTQATQIVAPRRPSGYGLRREKTQTVAVEPSIATRVEQPQRQGPGLFKTLLAAILLGLLTGIGFVSYRIYTAAQQVYSNFKDQAAELPNISIPKVELPEVELPELDERLPENSSSSSQTDTATPETDNTATPETDNTDTPVSTVDDVVNQTSTDPNLPDSAPSLILANSGNPSNSAPGGGGGNVPIRGFAPGTPATKIATSLGEPTRQSASPSATTAVYDLDPNRATVAYVYDVADETVKQSEAVFAPSYDRLVMRVTLTGMLNGQSTQAIENGLEQVRTGAVDRYPFEHNGLTGNIERNNYGFIHIYVR